MRRLFSTTFANLLVPLSGLLLSPFLSRELGPDGRGLYAALTLPIVICGWLGTLGLQDALTVHISHAQLSLRASRTVITLASVPLGILGFLTMATLGLFTFHGHADQYRDFVVLAVFAPIQITTNLLIGASTGASDLRAVNLMKAVPALSRTAIVIVACLAFNLSVFMASLLFMITSVSSIFIGYARLRGPSPQRGRHRAGAVGFIEQASRTEKIPARSLASYSLACLPGVLAAVSSARLDQVVGLPLIGEHQLGLYAVAVSVAEIPMVIATGARTILMGRSTGATPQAATSVARLAMIASIVACGFLAAIAPWAVSLVFGDKFAMAVGPTSVLCAATVLYTAMTLFTAALITHGNARWSSTALVVGSAAGIVSLFVLADHGAMGAAFASLIGYATSVLIAAYGLRVTRNPYTVRMLTLPFARDVEIVRQAVARLSRPTEAGRKVVRADQGV